MENNKLTLFQLSAEMVELENALTENGGELTPELEEAWTETEQGLVEKTDGYHAVIGRCEMYSDAIAGEIKRLQALKKTYDNTAKRIKEHMLSTMQMFGLKQLVGKYCKVTRAKTRTR